MTKGEEFIEALDAYMQQDKHAVSVNDIEAARQKLANVVDEIWDKANHSHSGLATKQRRIGG